MVVPHVEPILKAPLTEEGGGGGVKAEQLNSAGSQHDDVWDRKNSDSGLTTEDGAVHASTRVEVGPPAFLKKAFEMVEDPNTDPIVSWGETGHSFVVWDSHQFSKTLLPKYFKHCNFSSFIRQLNTYGFRKVESERWEFANEGFQGGKKHLLKSIKRRSKCNKLLQAGASFSYSVKPGLDLESEFERLKKEQNMLRVEILKLTQQHEGLRVQLTSVKERVRCAELKQFQMLVFITRMVKNPAFVEQLIHRVKGKGELDGAEMVKRRRLLGTQCPVSFPKGMDTTLPDVDCRHQGYEQLATLQSKFVDLLSETVNTSSSMELTIGSTARAHDVSCAYDVVSEKLMGESSVVGEEVDVNVSDSNIYHELEDLISRQAASGLVGKTS